MRVCVHVRVPMFSNDSCVGLGYDSGVSRTILGNMITRSIATGHAHISNA